MAKKDERKMYPLSGSARAEFEAVYGPLESADDTRFVLVDDELIERIESFPHPWPPRADAPEKVKQEFQRHEKAAEALRNKKS